ncbi:hypothetical protein F8388_012209 [Cannabis sativa]|uniref:RNase H type-1 domain-containing protein n=1 Tax=Cannabis sativa TaxID=3483 RepID=A0A7J6H8T2_CANSA|nr:hypothetical protein F8388_012209 [Cannabis sativa]KAF4390978.1 hypothetical protein G4B88_030656 [Cannabis sativa]
MHKEDIPWVLGIKTQRDCGEDELIWHYTTYGEFQVTSGYIRNRLEDQAAETSDKSMTELVKRGIKIEKTCTGCWSKDETIGHALWYCSSLKSVWKATGYWHLFPSGLGLMTALQEFLMHMEQQCTKHKFESFLGLSWLIWNQRNQRIFQNKKTNWESWIPWAMDFIATALQQPHENGTGMVVAKHKSWVAPPTGYFSLHCDAATGKEQQDNGIAVVIRNHDGRLVAAEVLFLEGYRSTVMAECLAIQLGLILVQKSKACPFFVNSDNQTDQSGSYKLY